MSIGAPVDLKPREFQEFRDLLYKASGITLGDGKESLVTSRLGKRMRALELPDFRSYLDFLGTREGEDEMILMLDAISTNVTSFFREAGHFDLIRDLMAEWTRQGQRRFRFWSAASSSGEEPYTLAMTLAECLPAGCDVRILATDISTRILAAAQRGRYAASKLESLPPGFASRYFRRVGGGSGELYEVDEALKRMILFRRLNLSTPPFPMQGPLDVILVRNVMIYFDNTVRKRLLDECLRLLKPGGYLLVGHAESLAGLTGDFKCLRPSVYAKKG
jgi:chemotaxis protein methyltransferase CheR